MEKNYGARTFAGKRGAYFGLFGRRGGSLSRSYLFSALSSLSICLSAFPIRSCAAAVSDALMASEAPFRNDSIRFHGVSKLLLMPKPLAAWLRCRFCRVL